jgi:hypothetical protein
MKPVLFLRIASILTFVHAVGHTLGGVFGAPPPGAQAAVAVMKADQFRVMGVMRSYWDFFLGLGLAGSITMLVEAVVFWQLGSLAKTRTLPLRPVLTAFLVGYAALAVNSFRYIFAPPAILEILIASCMGLAILTSEPAAST